MQRMDAGWDNRYAESQFAVQCIRCDALQPRTVAEPAEELLSPSPYTLAAGAALFGRCLCLVTYACPVLAGTLLGRMPSHALAYQSGVRVCRCLA